MPNIDVASVIFTEIVGYCTSIIVFLFYGIFNRGLSKNILTYILAKVFQVVCWIIFYVERTHLNNVNMSVASASLFVGLSLEIYCFLSTKKIPKRGVVIFLIIAAVLYTFFYSFFSCDVISRVIVTSVFYFFLFAILFIELSIKKGSTPFQKLVGWVALIFLVLNSVRGGYSLLQKFEFPIYTNAPMQYLVGTIWLFIAYTFPLIYLFILKEKDAIKLQELNVTKDKFFRIIGHDLKGPLGQVIQFSDTIKEYDGELNKELLLKLAELVNKSSLRSIRLLENLLDWARSQTGSMAFYPEKINIATMIADNVDLVAEKLKQKNITINVNTEENSCIIADYNMLNTIVRNILSNAIKFTHHGGYIEIKTKKEMDQLRVSIKDNGVGISDQDYKQLFKLDAGCSNKGTDNETGTGLGLILIKEFIDKHNGTIWVDSTLGKGSTFHFTIPSCKCKEK